MECCCFSGEGGVGRVTYVRTSMWLKSSSPHLIHSSNVIAILPTRPTLLLRTESGPGKLRLRTGRKMLSELAMSRVFKTFSATWAEDEPGKFVFSLVFVSHKSWESLSIRRLQ